MLGGWWSAAYFAAPVTLSTPSRRVSGWPIFEPCRMWAGDCESTISAMGENSRNNSEGRTRQRGHALGRAGGGKHKRPHDDPSRDLDFVRIVTGRLCLAECSLGGAAEYRCFRAL